MIADIFLKYTSICHVTVAGDEQAADLEDVGQDETDSSVAVKKNVDVDSVEDQLSGDPDSYAKIITNPQSINPPDGDDVDQGGRNAPSDRAANLREELHTIAEELQQKKCHRDAEIQEGLEESRELWGRLRTVTSSLSQRLCEQLRLVLEPMVATKLQGDYRSGKRINMRRVIPYIASGFRKDKIWLRRTKPAKRDYQVCVSSLGGIRPLGRRLLPAKLLRVYFVLMSRYVLVQIQPLNMFI